MASTQEKVELLAPAGTPEKLEIAIRYGADAVYLGDRHFSLRNYAGNFTIEQIRDASDLAHKHEVKVYIACNIYPRTEEAKELGRYFDRLSDIAIDGIIISDPGVLVMAKKIIPEIPIHLSTQANTTNLNAVKFWEDQGVARINLARELTLEQIREIAANTHVEIEAFVHGAMCISYSGRCLLSAFLSGRDSNRGQCSHPCRWKYNVVEEFRPGEYMPVTEDDRGSYIFSSKDLCMIEHIDKLIDAGIKSLKIEGRMKSINYLATTVKAYREAIDSYYENRGAYQIRQSWKNLLEAVNNRGFCTGFYFGTPGDEALNHTGVSSVSRKTFIAKALRLRPDGKVEVQVKNRLQSGDRVEVLTPSGPAQTGTIMEITDMSGNRAEEAKPNSTVLLALSVDCREEGLIRKID